MELLLELYTVPQAAEVLFKSESAVQRLLRKGKLQGIKEGGRWHIKPESLQDYIERLPHPPRYVAALRHSQNMLAYLDSVKLHGGTNYMKPEVRFWETTRPLRKAVVSAIKGKRYEAADTILHELWRAHADYQMLHAPTVSPPDPNRKPYKSTPCEQPLLLELQTEAGN